MPQKRPNILLIVTDQHNYRTLGSYEGERGEPVDTPTLDRLSENSATFENAYCSAPVCAPSRLSFLSGRRVPNAGAWGNHSVLRPGLDTLPQTLSDAGYETGLVGKMHLGGSRQYVGFDHRPYGDLTGKAGHQLEPPNPNWDLDLRSFVTDVGKTNVPESLTQDRTVAEESTAFVREHRAKDDAEPFFLCASFNRPHWPRTIPERFFDRYWPDGTPEPRTSGAERIDHPLLDFLEERHVPPGLTDEQMARARAAYFACVEFVDQVIGDFLYRLERDGHLEDTIVVYMSDHGDMIGEHGLWEKRVWYDDASRVPLAVQLPEHRSGDAAPHQLSTPVSLVDLYPTLCGLADVGVPDGLDGVDLADAVRTGTEPSRGPVFSDGLFDYGGEELEYRMVRRGQYKFVRCADAPDLFFDLEADPEERTNLVQSATGEAADALESLRDVVAASTDFEEIRRRRGEAEALKHDYRLGIPTGRSNAYQFPDGRIVDADSPLYNPHVLAEDPSAVFDDYPGESR